MREGCVSLRDLRHGRLADGGWLFDGLSMELAPGEFVGVTGPNGSGRSTLLRLIAGEVRADAGAVLVDGQDLAVTDAAPARRTLALVPPDPAMIAGTFLENLTLREAALTERAIELGVALGLESVAANLPGGWHTPVGTGGAPLPRGVAQRVGIVRALARQPRLLLLDDVTAQLDRDGDARLCALLATLRGHTTILLVSHRRCVLARADRVLRIVGGRLEPVA
jgi:ATP-binding cassette subfamily C protein LapB